MLARVSGPAPGDVRLLVGDAEMRAWVLLPAAVARRLAPRDIRVGDDIQPVGMWSAREVEDPAPFDPPGTLRVDKPGEIILAPGSR